MSHGKSMLGVALAGLAILDRLAPAVMADSGTPAFRIVLAITTDLALLAAFASLLRGSRHAVSFHAGVVAATAALEGTDALPLLLSVALLAPSSLRGRPLVMGFAAALGCRAVAHEGLLLRHHLQHYVDAFTEPPMNLALRLAVLTFLLRQAERALGARWTTGATARASS